MNAANSNFLYQLKQKIDVHFNIAEIKDLCFNLGVDHEYLPGDEKLSIVRSFLTFMVRRRKIGQLLTQLRIERPGEEWPHAPSDDELFRLVETGWDVGDLYATSSAHISAYKKSVLTRCGKVQMTGQPESVPLADVFVDAYVEGASRHDPPVKAMNIIREKSNVFILGRPGLGKTTFMKYVALTMAQSQDDKLPIFISLSDLDNTGLSIIDFIVSQFEIGNFPNAERFAKDLLYSGDVVVLFDGLDEVAQKQNKIQSNIINFTNKYHKSQHIITSRTASIQRVFEGFTYVELTDFSKEQISTFVAKWFATQQQNHGWYLAEELIDIEGLSGLTRSPLLLTMMCLFLDDREEPLRDRVDLYEHAINLLLKQWDESKGVQRGHNLSTGQTRRLLIYIAYENFVKGIYQMPRSDIKRQIFQHLSDENIIDSSGSLDDAEGVLQAIESQHGLLTEQTKGFYAFPHLSFQEFFIASYFADDEYGGTLQDLMLHMADAHWREVISLAFSMVGNKNLFIDAFFAQLNQMALKSEKLTNILHWADMKANQIEKPDGNYCFFSSRLDLRCCYLFFPFDFLRTTIVEIMLYLGCEVADGLGRALAIELNDGALFTEIILACDPDYFDWPENDTTFYDVLDGADIGFDFLLDTTFYFEQDAKSAEFYAEELKLLDLQKSLQLLSVPSTAQQRDKFNKQFQKIGRDYRQLRFDWQLTSDEKQLLVDWVLANKFLLEFLDADSYEKISEKLLNPPLAF